MQATSLMFIHNDFYGSMLDEYPMPINTHQLDEAVHADRLVGRAAFDGVGVSSDFCSSTHKLNKVCMQTGWWAGNTLLIDFPFAAFPDSMGHWAEVLLPLYSVLVNGDWKQQVQGKSAHIDRLLLTNVRREELQVCRAPLGCMGCLLKAAGYGMHGMYDTTKRQCFHLINKASTMSLRNI